MKTRLLKRLRKKVKKAYIITSDYPEFTIQAKCSDNTRMIMRRHLNLEEAIAALREHRNKVLKQLIAELRNKQRDKNLRKL